MDNSKKKLSLFYLFRSLFFYFFNQENLFTECPRRHCSTFLSITVLLCSQGASIEVCFHALCQVYYELDEERKKVDGKDVAICRVEQLSPFPYDLVQRELKRYPSMSSEIFGLSFVVKSQGMLRFLLKHSETALNIYSKYDKFLHLKHSC